MNSENLISGLRKILESNQILLGEDVKSRFSHIWKTDEPLQALAVTFPKNTEEVSEIVSLCN